MRDIVPAAELHMIYVAIIRSLFEYASPVFIGLNKKLSDRMSKIDRRAHRIIRSKSNDDATKLCECNHSTLYERRLCIAEKLFASIEKSGTSHLLFHCLPRVLSNSNQYSVPFASNNKYFNSFFPYMVRHINSKHHRCK